ncbi:hypothetical protein [Novosphingobium colocasiae]|uniref:hypothetical protein n=1 Tax=Novosphingobium colocasiae TaxID=1256513 RepID=UPI0035B109E2
MKFDSNRSWMEALADIRANRDLLLTVGAFFFLLPTLVSLVLTADLQVGAAKAMEDTKALTAFVNQHGSTFALATSAELLVNAFGMLALLRLLSERHRSTVGQALLAALQGIPGLMGIAALLMLVLLTVLTVVVITLGSLLIVVLGERVGGVLTAIVALVAGGLYPLARLSMAPPALVLEGQINPLRAAIWSWRVTRGNGVALALFYFLLSMAFSMVGLVMKLLFYLLSAVFGQGMVFYLLAGVLNGLLSLAEWLIVTAVLYRAYRQLTENAAAAG